MAIVKDDPVKMEIVHRCGLCGVRCVEVKIEDLDPAPPTLAVYYQTPQIDHAECFMHVRCPNCSPGWWAACIRIRMKDSKVEAKGPPS
jgi:hypothetical protein